MECSIVNHSFQIHRNDTVGRYAVTNSHFKPGDEIFSEGAFAIGPKPDGPPVCLGCHAPVDCSTVCTSCKWPVCGVTCENISTHKEAECVAFTRAKVPFQGPANPCLQYECIMPIRVLLASLRDNDRWNREVKMMESHKSARCTQPIWRFNEVNIVKYIRGPCKLGIFTEDLIHTVCGILECNAFEAYAKCGYPIRCLYPKLAILSHNCVSNTMHSIDSDSFQVSVYASTDICSGEELFSSYTYALSPTLVRNEFLLDSKYFQCQCERCSDPLELGTHLSSLLCDKCDGILTCESPMNRGHWRCSHCENCRTYTEVKTIFAEVQREIDRNVMGEELLAKYQAILHPSNAYFVIIKSSLIPHCRLLKRYDRAIQFANDVLETVNVIQPGHTRTRGVILYELFLSTILSAKENRQNLKGRLHEALCALRESVSILKLEADLSKEGQMGRKAQCQLLKFEEIYDDILEGKGNMCDLVKGN